MFNQLCRNDQILILKVYLVTFIVALAFYYPLFAYRDMNQYFQQLEQFHKKFLNSQKNQLVQDQSEIAFDEFLKTIQGQQYIGDWSESIKQSRMLNAENGTFKLQVIQNIQEKSSFKLQLKITDGNYIDNGQYVIILDSSAIKTKQQLKNNYLVYETISPIISVSSSQHTFYAKKINPIYINKLKFRISFEDVYNMKLQLLIAAEYDVNIIINELVAEKWVISHLLFAIVLVFQISLQIFGAYRLFQQNLKHQGMISPLLLKCIMSIDLTKLICLIYIFFTNEKLKTFLMIPLLLLVFLIYEMECVFISFTSTKNNGSNQANAESRLTQGSQNIIIGIVAFLFFCACNLSWVYFITASCIVISPQIIHSFSIIGKVHYTWQSFLTFICSNFILLGYLRLYENNIFCLEPSYLLCVFCLLIVGVQTILIAAQKKYGTKAIIPQFLLPKNLKQFKIFMIQTHDQSVCSICLGDLSALPPDIQSQSGEIIINKVVVTPCKHQFHYPCLLQWQQTKMQCPNCRRTLPPVDEEQLYNQ